MPALTQRVTDITQDTFFPAMTDNIYSGNVLTAILSRSPRTWRGGTPIRVPVYLMSGQLLNVGSYSGFDSFSTTAETPTQQASFNPSQYAASIPLSGIELAANRGEAAVVDLVASTLSIYAEALRQDMGTDVYGDGTGNNSKALLGLVAQTDDTTSVTTFGGISRTTYTNWRGTRTAQSGSLSLANLAADVDAAQVGTEKPNLLVTTPAVFTIYEALLTPTVTHNLSFSGYDMLTPGGEFQKNGPAAGQGFNSLYFRGIPLVADEKCTSGNIYTLNTRHLYWYVMP